MISKTSIHACHALTILAGLDGDRYIGAVAIARQTGAPPNYLGKLLKTLAQAGLVESQKGFGGGFRLAKPAQKISLFDVAEPIEQISRLSGCFLGRKNCTDKSPCAVHGRWTRVRDQYLNFLHETTIFDLMKPPT